MLQWFRFSSIVFILSFLTLGGCSSPMDPEALVQPYHHISNYMNLPDATCEVSDKTATIKSKFLTLVFNRGYQNMEINGMTYYLNQSATMQGVPTRDLKILREALFGSSFRKHRLLIMVDAGHGGNDPGCSAGALKEKHITFEVALEVKRLLELRGHQVVLSRDGDRAMTLKERTDKAAKHPIDACVSIHVNSTAVPTETARGVEVYLIPDLNCKSTTGYLPTEGESISQDFIVPSTKLALAVQQRLLLTDPSIGDRGVRHAYFRLVRDVPAPAILAEIGFINHPEDRARLETTAYRLKVARAIVDGIEDAFAVYPRQMNLK